MTVISCPSCNKKYNIKDKFIGKTVACTNCKTKFKLNPEKKTVISPPGKSQRDQIIKQLKFIDKYSLLAEKSSVDLSTEEEKKKSRGSFLEEELKAPFPFKNIAEFALKKNIISKKKLTKVLIEKTKLKEQGKDVSLENILMDKNILTEQTIDLYNKTIKFEKKRIKSIKIRMHLIRPR